MKKTIITTMFLSISCLTAQLRIGADVNGNMEVSALGITVDEGIGTGITLGYDHMVTGMFGAGGEFQVNRGPDDDEGGKFSFTSIYGVGRFGSGPVHGIVRIGYAIIFSGDDDFSGDMDTKGGIMYGIGAGYNINSNLGLEAGYYSNAGTGELKGDGATIKADVSYSRIYAGLTYSF